MGAASRELYSSCKGTSIDWPGVSVIGCEPVTVTSSCAVFPLTISVASNTGCVADGSFQKMLTTPLQSIGMGVSGGQKSMRMECFRE